MRVFLNDQLILRIFTIMIFGLVLQTNQIDENLRFLFEFFIFSVFQIPTTINLQSAWSPFLLCVFYSSKLTDFTLELEQYFILKCYKHYHFMHFLSNRSRRKKKRKTKIYAMNFAVLCCFVLCKKHNQESDTGKMVQKHFLERF